MRIVAAALAAVCWIASADVRPATACDVCAIYVGTTKQEQRRGPFFAIAQQFTHFGTLQFNGEEIGNPDGEKIDSSITQFVLGYTFTPRAHLQINVPFISRHFRRVTETGTETGDETGVGDIMLVGRYSLIQRVEPRSIINLDLVAGLKLPTGSTERLGEEPIPEPDAGDDALRFDRLPNPIPRPRHEGGSSISGVHGHDLTLGTGSVDGMLGVRALTTYRRGYFSGSIQYLMKTEGDFKYLYANELQWDGGLGGYLWLRHDYTLALEAWFHGETKGKDTQNGVRLADTSITALYVGPRIKFTYSTRSQADIGIGLPVVQNSTDLQLVPDWRVRAAWVWHF